MVILPDLSKAPATDLAARGEAIRAGEEAVRAAPQIRLLIASKTTSGASVKTGSQK